MPTNGNGVWRRAGVIITVILIFVGVVSGYADVKFKASKNEKDISEVKKDIKDISKTQIALQINSAKILEAVEFLKKKAE